MARKNLDVSARDAENYLHKLALETRLAEDLRVALEEEREVKATKYATLDIEARKKEKERQRQFERELAQTIDEFERQSKAFLKTIEDKALRNKLDKERMARKAELNRAVLTKVQPGGQRSALGSQNFTANDEAQIINAPIAVGSKVRTSFGNVGTEKDSPTIGTQTDTPRSTNPYTADQRSSM